MWAMIAVSIASKFPRTSHSGFFNMLLVAMWTGLLVWMHVRTEKRREMESSTTPGAEKEHAIGAPDEINKSSQLDEKV